MESPERDCPNSNNDDIPWDEEIRNERQDPPGAKEVHTATTHALVVAETKETVIAGELWDDENTRWVQPEISHCSSSNNSNSCGSDSSFRKKKRTRQCDTQQQQQSLPKVLLFPPAFRFWKRNVQPADGRRDKNSYPKINATNRNDLEETFCSSNPGDENVEENTPGETSSALAIKAQQLPHPETTTLTDDDNSNVYMRMESNEEDNNDNNNVTKQHAPNKSGITQRLSVLLLQWKQKLLQQPSSSSSEEEDTTPTRKTCCWIGMSMSALATAAVAVTLALAVPAMLYYNPKTSKYTDPHSIFSTVYRTAFLGNSITFVNDLPRFMENLSGNSIRQNSCLHASLNLATLLQKGNGMYNKWRTENAILDYVASSSDNSEKTPIYDFGACTVQQLLLGYDSSITSNNNNNNNNNKMSRVNPCNRDPDYLEYITDYQDKEVLSRSKKWDYVIMNDQTLYPGTVEKREKSISALSSTYAGYLATSKATPVFIVTYGYSKAAANSDDDASTDDDATAVDNSLGDIPEFTSRIYYGYQQYRNTLKELLPNRQRPLLAPVGLAFLVIYEENYDFWLELFYDDGFHPSPHGTFLMGCCIYATIYNSMPPNLPKSDDDVVALFGNARMMHSNSMGEDKNFPTAEEAEYLAEIAKRVVLDGYVPTTLLDSDTVAKMEEEEANGGNNRKRFRW